jgi:hypothetical protein
MSVKEKAAEIEGFLDRNNIVFKTLVVSGNSKIVLNQDTTVSANINLTRNMVSAGLDAKLLKKLQALLQDLNGQVAMEKINDEFQKTKLNSLLSKVDKTLKGGDLDIQFVPSDTFGGVTYSRKKIILNDPRDVSFEEYSKVVPGINYHELGHVLYTCSFVRLGKKLKEKYSEYVAEAASYTEEQWKHVELFLLRVVNIFEDGRIENIMGNKYGTSVAYFKSTMVNFLLKTIEQKKEKIDETDCVLVAGRKYLEPEVRRWIFDKYMESDPQKHTLERAKRVNSYINKYITLSWKNDREEMIDLCLGFFFEFLKEELDEQVKDVKKWNEFLSKLLKNAETMVPQIKEGEDGDIDESEQQILNKVVKEMKDEIKEKGEQVSHGGSKDSDGSHDYKIRKMLEAAKEKDQNAINEESHSLKAKLKSIEVKHQENKNFRDHEVTPLMKKLENDLERKLKLFTQKCRNGYLSRKKKGTVDIGEARRQEYRGGMRIFRQYRKNVRKELNIDVAFVLDCSASMSGSRFTATKLDSISKQLWIASTACKTVGAKIKVLSFSDNFLGVIAAPHLRNVYRVPASVCGTQITDTLYIAENYLLNSTANTKWLIVLTDGGVSDEATHRQIIERIRTTNVTCGKINLEYGGHNIPEGNYDHVLNIDEKQGKANKGENIVTFFEQIYRISLEKTGRNIA